MNTVTFNCERCGNTQYVIGEFCAPRNYWAALVDFNRMKFTTLSCNRCGFTELFKGTRKDFEQASIWFNRPMR